MTVSLHPVLPSDPVDALHSAAARIAAVERELAEARAALATAEAALAAPPPAVMPDALRMEQVARIRRPHRSAQRLDPLTDRGRYGVMISVESAKTYAFARDHRRKRSAVQRPIPGVTERLA